ncbi:MAG: tetratricopeptide repeat protein [Anaerolineae bacterium]
MVAAHLVLAGWRFYERDQLDHARAVFFEATCINYGQPDAYLGLGHSYVRLGDFDRAIEAYSQPIKVLLGNHEGPIRRVIAEALNSRGLVYEEQGKFDLARADFVAAKKLGATRQL